jgi:hypothetical protein
MKGLTGLLVLVGAVVAVKVVALLMKPKIKSLTPREREEWEMTHRAILSHSHGQVFVTPFGSKINFSKN